jgi:4-hydroxy-tetrahydrodipicolinate synthase
MANSPIKGLLTPQLTIFQENNEVDHKATIHHVQWLIENGVSGIVPFGTFGEGASLSLKEKIEVTNGLIEINRHGALLIPTLICNSLGEIWEYLEFAQGAPLDGIMVIPPGYFKGMNNDSLKRFYDLVTSRTDHEIIAYNIPACAPEVPVQVASNLDIWGVKDSSGSLESAKNFIDNDVRVLIGSDSLLLDGLQAGALGGICGLSNLFPREFSSVYRLHCQGDLLAARKILERVMSIANSIFRPEYGAAEVISVVKSVSEYLTPLKASKMRLPVASIQPSKADLDRLLGLIASD